MLSGENRSPARVASVADSRREEIIMGRLEEMPDHVHVFAVAHQWFFALHIYIMFNRISGTRLLLDFSGHTKTLLCLFFEGPD